MSTPDPIAKTLELFNDIVTQMEALISE